jgi:hypothetical protein
VPAIKRERKKEGIKKSWTQRQDRTTMNYYSSFKQKYKREREREVDDGQRD